MSPTCTPPRTEDIGPDYLEAFRTATLVITEAGGRSSHACDLCREFGVAVLRWPGARAKAPEGRILRVDLDLLLTEWVLELKR